MNSDLCQEKEGSLIDLAKYMFDVSKPSVESIQLIDETMNNERSFNILLELAFFGIKLYNNFDLSTDVPPVNTWKPDTTLFLTTRLQQAFRFTSVVTVYKEPEHFPQNPNKYVVLVGDGSLESYVFKNTHEKWTLSFKPVH